MKRMFNNCNCNHGLSLRPFQMFQEASLRKTIHAAMISGIHSKFLHSENGGGYRWISLCGPHCTAICYTAFACLYMIIFRDKGLCLGLERQSQFFSHYT